MLDASQSGDMALFLLNGRPYRKQSNAPTLGVVKRKKLGCNNTTQLKSCPRQDSNLRPLVPETNALSTELRRPTLPQPHLRQRFDSLAPAGPKTNSGHQAGAAGVTRNTPAPRRQ